MYDLIDRKMRSAERSGLSVGLIRVRMREYATHELDESAIIKCAELLANQLRPDDIVGRMGIYEFLIVLAQDASHSNYDRTFERVMNRCAMQNETQLEFATTQSQSHEKVRDVLNRLDTQPVFFS